MYFFNPTSEADLCKYNDESLFSLFYDNSQHRRLLFFDLMLVILAIAFLVALQLGHTLYPKMKDKMLDSFVVVKSTVK